MDGQTTLAFVSLMEYESQEPQYAFYSQDTVDREMTESDLPKTLPEKVLVLHFGSISLVLETSASALETLMRRESNQRAFTLGPNVRPIIISDCVAYRKRFGKWASLVDIFRLSKF